MEPVTILFIALIVVGLGVGALLGYMVASRSKSRPRRSASARSKEDAVVQEATEKAKKIVREAQFFRKHAEEELDHLFEDLAHDVNARAEVMSNTLVESFDSTLSRSMKDFQSKLEKTYAQIFLEARGRVAEFEQEEKKRIIADLEKRAPAVIKEISGAAISLESHEGLIEAAFDRAVSDLRE